MKKQKLLHIVPHDNFVPPKSGGALRCYHLCVELAKHYDVTLLTLQKSDTFGGYLQDVKVINPAHFPVKSGLKHKIVNAIRYRRYMKSLRGPSQSTVLEFYPILKELSGTTDFKFIIIEFLYAIELGSLTNYLFPKAIRVSDLHNVDHLLFSQFSDIRKPENKKQYTFLKRKESNLQTYVDYFFVCSNKDLELLNEINTSSIQGFVVPNGVTVKSTQVNSKDYSHPNLIFCGNLKYPPNKRGLLWFYQNIWPLLKNKSSNITLTVVGRNGDDGAYETLKKDNQINFVGEVDSVLSYYSESNIAIVPLLEGSGTRLKVLEAMSLGNPVVSTTIGAEGIDHTDKFNIILEDEETTFADAIVAYLDQPKELGQIADNALLLIKEKYDWVKIGMDVSKILNALKKD